MMQDVQNVIDERLSDPTLPVRFRAEGVARYEAAIGLEYVLADFFANRARQVLQQQSWGLAEVEDQFAAQLGVPLRSGDPSRPHVSATGEALAYLRAAGDAPEPPLEPPRRRWAVEQALEWTSRG
jgi:hypothetical protein